MIRPALNHIVSLQQRSAVVDAVGQRVQTWAEIARPFSRVSPLQGRALLAAQSIHAEVTSEVLMRYSAALAAIPMADLRALFRGRYLTVHAVIDVEERRRWLRLMCSEGAHES